jgi:predicted metalloprotease
MKWRRKQSSPNVQDRRGGGGGGGLGGLPMPMRAGAVSLPVLLLTVAVIVGLQLCGGGGFSVPGLDRLPQAPVSEGEPIPPGADPDANLVDFMEFVVDDVQAVWDQEFRQAGEQYEFADLVLFEEGVDTGCGQASSEVGPFYCPADRQVYIDLDFFRELNRRFGAPGDFAQAYVIAHEYGHHVQNLLGISGEVQRQQQANPDQANELSIRIELQADCLAGVWGYTTQERGILERGDLQEGLTAAAAVGDDRIQKQATGTTNPETWTHGSSEQRQEWFSKGFETGDPDACDTFSGDI